MPSPSTKTSEVAFPHISLEQWRALAAVIECGGYAQAAEALHKSQSSITYAVQKIESLLNLQVFAIKGRRARVTEAGEVLYRRARALIEDALAMERGAGSMAQGWQPEIALAAEIIFPTWLLLECFKAFSAERPETRIELYETVLSGTEEALTSGKVDLAICSQIPKGFLGNPLMRVRAPAVAHPDHPLHKLGRPLTHRDLRRYRQLIIRDTGSQRTRAARWDAAEQRWTVSNKATFIRALCMGMGFAWFPEDAIRDELAAGLLKPLPLREGGERFGELYLVFADADYASHDVRRLAELLHAGVARECVEEHGKNCRVSAAPAQSPRRKAAPRRRQRQE